MPLLYSLGQIGALEATQEELVDGENLVAYLDDRLCPRAGQSRVWVARHRFGTGAESDLRDVMRWSRPESPCLAWVW